jgi:hypothetical protein
VVKPTEFLGYCGLNTLWDITKQVVAVLDEITAPEDFLALMSHMSTYINALGSWNLQLFPWELGGDKWSFRPTIMRSAHA